ncbi:MAG: hypothetical protein ACM3XM_00955 [Mycobacterium leprae]
MSDLSNKLKLKLGQEVAILHAPAGYREQLGELPGGITAVDETTAASQAAGSCDFVQLFAGNLAELAERVPEAIRLLTEDGTFWISYPKGTSKLKSDLNRDTAWEAMKPTGLRPVSQVAVDDTWSALRFRPAEKVGK